MIQQLRTEAADFSYLSFDGQSFVGLCKRRVVVELGATPLKAPVVDLLTNIPSRVDGTLNSLKTNYFTPNKEAVQERTKFSKIELIMTYYGIEIKIIPC